ncbi:Competence-damaged protein [Pseudobacteroides cellulosolvens ATCC 35603 = DSM 2933]|uniref:Putative competence-damage inducible protein n=1 Tax=Pseudobacteroides cellulosolvens ATCC 35603 = DSM 2933 TaxID=398512 RepID=A0A0L6JKN3_9FIRM|nr:Competence-damaged protein [Pseudobacteroides cellulosolvens ATCC 35603 = DSM 2933]
MDEFIKAEILAVGTELLMGQIANTNAQHISARLPEVGIGVYYHTVVGDNPSRLKDCLELALKRADVVIMTGGLGPTKDDLTKETIAEFFGRKLVLHQESLQKIEAFFNKLNRTMTENNKKQAFLPEGSLIIENNNGTAPGCIIEDGKKVVIMLPGPPKEMKPMFDETVIGYFSKKASFKIVSRFLRIFGIGESAMEEKIIDLIDGQSNPTIAPYAKDGEVTLRITARCNNGREGEELIKPVIDEIRNRLGDAVYSIDNENLEEVTGKLLIKNNISISFAESCTGGLLSSRITEIPGISAVFSGSMVTYSNEIKAGCLGVSEDTLNTHGAVSSSTAKEMAVNIRKQMNTKLGVSVTGIAGPGGATENKPIGLVYVALADENDVACTELNLWGDRNRIRNNTVLNALDMIRRYILKNYK